MAFWDRAGDNALQPAQTVDLVKVPAGAPAVDLAKVRETHVELAKKADKVGIELGKRGLSGIRAKVLLILDHSRSMVGDYANGNVQALVERALAFGLQVAVDGVVTVLPFDSHLRTAVRVGVTGDQHNGIVGYRGVVNDYLWLGASNMGSTNMAAPLEALRQAITDSNDLWFCVFATDGDPDYTIKARTTELICDLSRYPVFIKFLALRPVAYLSELDNLPNSKRLLDNVNAQPHTRADGRPMLDLLTCTDLEFASAMTEEWDEWILRAQKAGVLR